MDRCKSDAHVSRSVSGFVAMVDIIVAIFATIAMAAVLVWRSRRNRIRRVRRMEWRAGIDRRWAEAQDRVRALHPDR